MTKISLRAYDREIEGLIEHDQQTEEAIAHCRQILKTFPKHLETYRLLGKAYLEAKRQREAVDIFERVLLTAPEDFVSHVGMSIIADEQGGLDDAIWHMERAFEVQPSNAAIQGELQRLFGRRDGTEPPKIRLTRGALARMYMQGELYSQAISEIKAVLSADPKRTDMQILLAKAHYLNGQKNEAAALSTEVLSRYPYCLDANRVMAEILSGTQRAEAAQEHRQRVIELDPYAAFATDSLFRSENVPDNAVNLERLEYSGPLGERLPALGLAAGTAADGTIHAALEPEWLASGGAPSPSGGQGNEPPAQPAAELPDFLKEAGWSALSSEPSTVADIPSAPVPAEPPAEPANLPDWIRAFAPAEAAEPEPKNEEVTPVESPDWLGELGSAPAQEIPAQAADVTAGSAVPDWLRDLGGQDLGKAEATPLTTTTPEASVVAPQPPIETQPETAPDWLKELTSGLDEPAANSAPTIEVPSAAPTAPASEPSIGVLGTTGQEQDDAIAWLESLAAKHGAKPEELVTDVTSRQETAPDWVEKAKEIGSRVEPEAQAPQAEPGQASIPTDLDLTGKWLTSLQAGEPTQDKAEPTTPAPAKSEVLDWINSLAEQGDFTEAPPGDAEQRADVVDESGRWREPSLPAASPAGAASDDDEIPVWLGRTASKPDLSAAATGKDGDQAEPVDLPAWLAGLDEEQKEAQSNEPDQDAAPMWLRPESDSAPQAAEPTRPADWRPAEVSTAPAAQAPTDAPAEEIPAFASAPEQTAAAAPEREAPPAQLRRARPVPVSLQVSGNGPTSLEGAQAELSRGNIAASLDVYARLIRKGKSLEQIIRDLRDALYRYPVEIPIWQALGDAYMRANRLQDALDAYTKAEELLR